MGLMKKNRLGSEVIFSKKKQYVLNTNDIKYLLMAIHRTNTKDKSLVVM